MEGSDKIAICGVVRMCGYEWSLMSSRRCDSLRQWTPRKNSEEGSITSKDCEWRNNDKSSSLPLCQEGMRRHLRHWVSCLVKAPTQAGLICAPECGDGLATLASSRHLSTFQLWSGAIAPYLSKAPSRLLLSWIVSMGLLCLELLDSSPESRL